MKKIYRFVFVLCFSSILMASGRNAFEPKDFSKLIGMQGFTDKALEIHFKLYGGYVKNTNIVGGKLDELKKRGEERTPAYAGYKRMYGWEYNGMRLHELYFENLGGNGVVSSSSEIYMKLANEFGSFENWKKDFIATGMMRGIGWSVLYFDGQTGRLTNAWINEHDLGHLSGNQPLLIMDVFEHAYMPDYQLDRAGYIQAFFKNIDWQVVTDRFQMKGTKS